MKGGHDGLSAPVPRGRKGKKARKESKLGPGVVPEGALGWVSEEKFDTEMLINNSIKLSFDKNFLPSLNGLVSQIIEQNFERFSKF